MTLVKTISSLSEIINKYDLFIIDQWGVMHDGKKGYPSAINCIEKLYLIPNGENNSSILVTGSHLIFDKSKMKFIFVKDLSESKESDIKTDTLVCLITSDHTIPLGNYIFHDWEDNQDIYQNIN